MQMAICQVLSSGVALARRKRRGFLSTSWTLSRSSVASGSSAKHPIVRCASTEPIGANATGVAGPQFVQGFRVSVVGRAAGASACGQGVGHCGLRRPEGGSVSDRDPHGAETASRARFAAGGTRWRAG